MKKSLKPTKILFLSGYFGVGGKERQLTELIKNLPDNYKCYLGVKSADAYYLDQILTKLKGFYSLNKQKFSLLDIFWVYKVIKEVKPDVIFSWSDVFSHFSLVLYKASWLMGSRFKFIDGSIRDAPIKKLFTHHIETFLLKFSPNVVSNSFAGLKAYNQDKQKNRFVLYNGFDFSRIPNISNGVAREKSGLNKDAFIVSMVGGLRDAKDFITFCRAAKECLRLNPNILFYIIGDGKNRQDISKFIRDNNIANIFMLGIRQDIENIFKASDVSALCSSKWHGEGISNSILESLACGTPVIATKGGGTNEILEDSHNGFIIPNGDYRALAEKVLFLEKNRQTLKKMSVNAKTTSARFNIDSMLSQFENIINSSI